ncbi:MAG: hypothetical protein IJ048_10455 [Clostridia bacterium]|nr:hypothetical protein [Clostridia bacterium]
MEKAKKIVMAVYVVAMVAMFAILLAMGLEISNHMNPDVLLPEAYALGVCFFVAFVCLMCRAYWLEKREKSEREELRKQVEELRKRV